MSSLSDPSRREAATTRSLLMSIQAEFEKEALRPATSLVGEFISFLADNKKWWLLPIVLFLAFFGLLAAFAATGAAPFIYTLF
jgi:hypothetical protein